MRILVIDVGGTHVKVLATVYKRRVEFPSGPKMTPAKMVAAVRAATADWRYDGVSIGYPSAERRAVIKVTTLPNASRLIITDGG